MLAIAAFGVGQFDRFRRISQLKRFTNYDLHWGEHVLLGQATTQDLLGVRVWAPHVNGWNMGIHHQLRQEFRRALQQPPDSYQGV